MLTLEEIKKKLADRNLSEVARRIGMHRQQLWLVASGLNKNPTLKTLKKISEYLESEE